MRLGRDAGENKRANETREEVREIAEALSLYRSAMQHIAEREAARPLVSGFAKRRPVRRMRFGLLLAPALSAAVAAGVLVPVYNHFHPHKRSTPAPIAKDGQANGNDARAALDDTALMNQIDNEVSEDVPDALRPLAELSDPTTTTTTSVVSEKKDATQE